MSYIIRTATSQDASGMAAVHIQSWLETYPGIMPQKKLDSLNLEASTHNWSNAIVTCEVVMVAEVEDRIIGFVSGGKNRTQECCETGQANHCDSELAAMYMLSRFHGVGIGRVMFRAFTQALRDLGYRRMAVWVAEKNSTTGFYQHMGGKLIDRKTLIVWDQEVPLIAFSYDLSGLEDKQLSQS